jgi:hypothetical protein
LITNSYLVGAWAGSPPDTSIESSGTRNRAAAKAPSLTVQPTLLARADEVIE